MLKLSDRKVSFDVRVSASVERALWEFAESRGMSRSAAAELIFRQALGLPEKTGETEGARR
jgi:hypothetical protein